MYDAAYQPLAALVTSSKFDNSHICVDLCLVLDTLARQPALLDALSVSALTATRIQQAIEKWKTDGRQSYAMGSSAAITRPDDVPAAGGPTPGILAPVLQATPVISEEGTVVSDKRMVCHPCSSVAFVNPFYCFDFQTQHDYRYWPGGTFLSYLPSL